LSSKANAALSIFAGSTVLQGQARKIMADYVEYSKALAASGVLRGGSELAPVNTATTVRVRNGQTLTTDGPFAETKEQLGGYYLIEVEGLDAAMHWAARIPSAALHAARADLLRRAGRGDAARAAYLKAIELAPHPGERAYLARRLTEISAHDEA
jgi:hypothetical protein